MAQDQSTFNGAAYLAANPDVARAGLDPWYHYQAYGQREGRQATFDAAPTPLFGGLRPSSSQPQYNDELAFNEQAYLAANPDVAKAGIDPWTHYQQYGIKEGRQASFDQAGASSNPVQNEYTFNSAAYLAANPDVAAQLGRPMVETAWQHYINSGKNEGRQAIFDRPVTPASPSEWVAQTYGANDYDPGRTYYTDPKTGNVYNVRTVADRNTGETSLDFENAQRVASGAALNDPFLQVSGLASDPVKAQELYSLKETNPNAYYKTVADKLQNQIFQGYYSNANTDAQINALDKIKSLDPAAYYENKIKSIGHNIGWNIGQNTNDRNAPKIEELKSLIPEAIKAGLNPQQINSLVNQTSSEASAANQQRIANEAASGNFYTQSLLGALKVGGLALGAYGLDTALAAGLTAGGTGLTGGTGGAGGLLNAGAGGAFNLSGAAATQSALGLGSAPAGLLTSSVGLGGTAGAGSLAGIAGSAAAAGLGNLGTGLTAEQLAQYTGSNLGTSPTGTNMEEFANYFDLGFSDQAAADANWEQLMAEYNQAGGYAGSYSPEGYGIADGYALGDPTEIANFTGEVAAGALPGSTLAQFASLAKQYGPTVAKSLLSSGLKGLAGGARTGTGSGLGDLLGGLAGGATSMYLTQQQRQAIQNAYNQQAATVQAAGQRAESLASFTPVGMTTAFGQSNFQFDPATGKLTSAGYTPTAQVAGQVQNLFGLGAQALPTTTNTQAVQQNYIAQQQGLLAPTREQQLAQLRNRQYQRGTTGLATGGTQAGYTANAQGLMATNPEMAAYYNALAQQDAALAANAPTYAQNLLNQQIATGTGLFGAANTLEGYAQQPLSLSTDLGKIQAAAGASAGQLGLTGATKAADLTAQGALLANAAMQGTYNQLGTTAGQFGQMAGNLLSQNPTIAEWLK